MKAGVAAALALLLAVFPAATGAGGAASVRGKVVNGTSGGGPVAGLEVTLTPRSSQAAPLSSRTNPQGQFDFAGLPGGREGYTLAVQYQGVSYGTEFEATGGTSGDLEVYVYDTTTATDALEVLLDHSIVEVKPEQKRVTIVNYIQPLNGSDRTVVASPASGGQGSLFPLPNSAKSVEVLAGPSDVAVAAGGQDLTRAIPPGEHKLVLAYDLPYAGDSLVFHKPLAYPTQRVVLLMSAADGRAESDRLSTVEEVDSATGPYRLLSAEGLPGGTLLEVRLTGLAAAKGGFVRDILLPATPVALFLLVVTAVGVFTWRRRRRAAAATAG
ncbi:MAG: carboxypeptidase regulatory-like domain-containing protein [Chloroflexi bacterium]|nr:carboxypeptidase regulatory-like domain-containing protein [Chloroflexota bacterium]